MTAALHLDGVGVRTDGATLLHDVDWQLERGRHAVVLGPNGAGKTTLLRVVAGLRLPTTGTVQVLGATVGRVDLRALRRRIGIVSSALDHLLDRRAPVRVLVAAAIAARTAPLPEDRAPDRLAAADEALDRAGGAHLADRRGATLSVGEWQRVLLARALVTDPDLVLLDEPCVGLDLAQRARFLTDLHDLQTGPDAPTTVVVTHHLEEVSAATTDALLLRDGRVVARGDVEDVLADAPVSTAYATSLRVRRRADGWTTTA